MEQRFGVPPALRDDPLGFAIGPQIFPSGRNCLGNGQKITAEPTVEIGIEPLFRIAPLLPCGKQFDPFTNLALNSRRW